MIKILIETRIFEEIGGKKDQCIYLCVEIILVLMMITELKILMTRTERLCLMEIDTSVCLYQQYFHVLLLK